MLYILTSVWVLRTSNAGQNLFILCFLLEKHKKEDKRRNNESNEAKHMFFRACPQMVVKGFIPRKLFSAHFCSFYLLIFIWQKQATLDGGIVILK